MMAIVAFQKRGYRPQKRSYRLRLIAAFLKTQNTNTNPKNLKSNTNPENSKSNTIYSQYKHTKKIQNQTQHTQNTNTPMNLLSFNKTNPNLVHSRKTKEQAQEHKPI